MTKQEIEKLNNEFSNEFDVLYNNITSNQAPGLDEYEKSVFLTKAQDEIVKAYFNPKTNKVQEGFDGNEKRQIDFSMIMRSKIYQVFTVYAQTPSDGSVAASTPIKSPIKLKPVSSEDNVPTIISLIGTNITVSDLNGYANLIDTNYYVINKRVTDKNIEYLEVSPFKESFFDMRDNTKSITLEDDILMFVNEYAEAGRGESDTRLTILPINYTEYSRLMSKPFKRPIKNQAWRLLDNSDGHKKAEIVIGPNDTITKYVIRYVKRPRAIRLTTFDDVTLDGGNTAQCCELDPILFPEIIQRACELAKAAYTGDLQSQVALGQASQTNIGMVTQSR